MQLLRERSPGLASLNIIQVSPFSLAQVIVNGVREQNKDTACDLISCFKFSAPDVTILIVVKMRHELAFVLVLVLAASELVTGQIAVSDCARCHQSIADEWRESLHFKAYSTLQFVAQKKRTVDTSCTCHSPDLLPPDNLGKLPTLRKEGHESGVDCMSCHVDAEMVIWSSGARKFVPHWTHQAEVYSTGEFCAGCHSWARESGTDCSICHMPEVDGPAADGPNLEIVLEATHLSHRWAGSADTDLVASALNLEVEPIGEELAVDVTNMVFAHKFPATNHRKVVIVLFDEEKGQVLWEEQLEIPASSTVHRRIRKPVVSGGFAVQVRYYPAPEIGSKQFVVIGTQRLEE